VGVFSEEPECGGSSEQPDCSSDSMERLNVKQGSTIFELRNFKTARQQDSKTARQQDSKTLRF
jgi:hypothetical protein